MPEFFVKPARDAAGKPLLVRDPATLQPLAEAGEWKPKFGYWARRVLDHDVIEAEPPAPDAPAAPAPAPAIEPAPVAPPEKLITQSA